MKSTRKTSTRRSGPAGHGHGHDKNQCLDPEKNGEDECLTAFLTFLWYIYRYIHALYVRMTMTLSKFLILLQLHVLVWCIPLQDGLIMKSPIWWTYLPWFALPPFYAFYVAQLCRPRGRNFTPSRRSCANSRKTIQRPTRSPYEA